MMANTTIASLETPVFDTLICLDSDIEFNTNLIYLSSWIFSTSLKIIDRSDDENVYFILETYFVKI